MYTLLIDNKRGNLVAINKRPSKKKRDKDPLETLSSHWADQLVAEDT